MRDLPVRQHPHRYLKWHAHTANVLGPFVVRLRVRQVLRQK